MALLVELAHAFLAVLALMALVSILYLTLTDLPLEPFLIGALLGLPAGTILLAISAPRRRRR